MFCDANGMCPMPEVFVSKIRSWSFNNYDELRSLLSGFSSFAPETLFHFPGRASIAPDWSLLRGIASLKHLKLDRVDSDQILKKLGSLESLTISNLYLTLAQPSEVAALSALLDSVASRIRFSFSVAHEARDRMV